MRRTACLLAALLLAGCVTEDTILDRQRGQVLVCHDDRTLAVSNASLYVHESHGDAIGPCPREE